MQLEMERFIELKRSEEENTKLREALEDIASTGFTYVEMLNIARKALGSEAHE